MVAIYKYTAIAFLLVVVLTTPVKAQLAQMPSSFPRNLPPGPLSYSGAYQRERAERKFYEGLAAEYEARKVVARRQLSEAHEREKRARDARKEKMRIKGLERQRKQQAELASQARILAASIREGGLRVPAALNEAWARKRLNRVVQLIKPDRPLTFADNQELAEIISELRGALKTKKIGSSSKQRSVARRFLRVLEYSASSPTLVVTTVP